MLYYLYRVKDNDKLAGFWYTPVPKYDAQFWEQMGGYELEMLTKPLPLGYVYALAKVLSRAPGFPNFIFRRGTDWVRRLCGSWLTRMNLPGYLWPEDGVLPPSDEINMALIPEETELLADLLKGRILLSAELVRCIDEARTMLGSNLKVLLQNLHLTRRVEILPGVGYESAGTLKCFRCGGTEKIMATSCARCKLTCYYCEECILLGVSRFCDPIYRGLADDRKHSIEVWPVLQFNLSHEQAQVAESLTRFVKADASTCLVTAVCGAGKTEAAFFAIAEALSLGQKVLFTAPRRDVIAELYPRFIRAFAEVKITALYGGSPSKYEDADITLATTHQLIRFNRKFDLVVFDEVDAFPFRGNVALAAVLERARSIGSKTIFMSATPDNKVLREIALTNGEKLSVASRPHGRPLPVPREWLGTIKHKGNLHVKLIEWLYKKAINERGQVLIFVPAVMQVEDIRNNIIQIFGPAAVQGVHSKDRNRDQKRIAFQNREFPFLVTTTVFERGITVPDCHVLVLWADNEQIFTESTLIQIAGRAGRTMEHPEGDVLFAAQYVSPAMRAAGDKIKEMNCLAKLKGHRYE